MRYSNLSNNMMMNELWTTITIQIQYVDGREADTTDTTRHQGWQSTPTRSCWIHPCIIYMEVNLFWWCKDLVFGNFQVTIQIFIDGCLI